MLETLVSHQALLLGSAFVLGLLVGSFLNVVIYRLPIMMEREYKRDFHSYFGTKPDPAEQKILDEPFNLILPYSHCPSCGAEVKPWHNVPLLSFLLLKGRCSHCDTPISKRYPLVELVTGLLTALVAWQLGFTWQALAGCGFTWALVALTGIDFDKQLLPDSITLPLLWTGLLVNLWGLFTPLSDAVIGAMAGYLSLWAVFHLFKLVTGKEGMGAGDFKILAAIGAWFGWQMLPMVILLSAGVGALAGLSWSLIAGRDKNLPIAFGPYLAGAGWIAMLWGERIVNWYLNFSGLGS
ncbi:A24 family peptidase [Microbulbifer thermotolerans]|uniref:prepilin peptidase n=1 Tax=Microbulbifer thermotolerans TaxID=252514 RepID=UPI00224B3B2E|nr:A24 family peptidase [Microbulbifer thermotolerans]MCX2780736.1 A24 family peptidase [Microbulbifer thermotolerans]MCX2781396.1 A24 family peptidase [Microbulbifer thermotolerans]MCX2806465.1 A24 family peptidase [Microbulbifer thermotolerans]MCX2841576.1 A24 family peptidase [Microbulbifer thermotolerans]